MEHEELISLLIYANKHGWSWGLLSRVLGIPGATLWDVADGKPVPGKWKRRLGLHKYKDLFAMPVDELRWALKNREEM